MFQRLSNATIAAMRKFATRPVYVAYSRLPHATPHVHAVGDKRALEQLTVRWNVVVAKVQRNSTIEWDNLRQDV